MADIIPPSPVDSPFGSYNWADWYEKVRRQINNAQNISWSQITSFSGSSLSQLATRPHSQLTSILGNGASHVSVAEAAALAAGYSGTITTAKLTGGGVNGSMTFTNGVLTAQVAAT